jgi:four helix bundle protein
VLGGVQGLRSCCARRELRSRPGLRLRALPVGELRWVSRRREGKRFMAFEVEEVAIQVIEALRPLIPRIKARDRALADQLTRAATSAALNIGESNYSDPGNRRARLFTAAGSANETRVALRVAAAWGHCSVAEAEAAQALLVRCLGMLWKLTRG